MELKILCNPSFHNSNKKIATKHKDILVTYVFH